MRRGILLLILLALPATKPEAAPYPEQPEQFQKHWNEFANEANQLMHAYESANVWNVKKARQVEVLFDRLRNDPEWKN